MNKTRSYIGSFSTALLLGIAATSLSEITEIESTPAPTLVLHYFEVDTSKTKWKSTTLFDVNNGPKGSGKGGETSSQSSASKTKSSSTNSVGNGSHGSGGKIDSF